MSSDYLLLGLGYNPDQSAKRLGDGLFEQKLIQQAVVARTGQRFIDGQTSDEAVFKYLMNNAIASKSQLNLSLGVTLTSQQVAALTHDIVWLEEHEVNGEKVLVPVLYLANANNRLAANGALIQGSDVTLIAGKDLNNAGTLRASQNLEATAKKNLVSSGLVEAGERLDLLATNNLTNKAGGIIAGRDVTLSATNGDVVNERTVTSHDSSVGDYSHARDFVDSAARIEAANKLVINAGRDVLNTGGVLKSGGDMTIDATRDVSITAVEERHSDSRTDFLNSSITQHGAEVISGAGLTIDAGRDIAVVASKLDAKDDVTLEAKRDVFFGAAANEEHSYFKDKKETRQEDHVSQIGTSLDAGGKLTIKSGKDMTLVASDISAGKEAYLHADGDLQLLAAQDRDYSLYDMKKKGSFGSEKTQRDEVTDIKNIGSQIKAGGDLSLVSGGNQRYQNAHLESGKDITLDSGGSITFEAVKDFHDESHTKSSSNAAWFSAEGKGRTDETLRQTQMVAGGSIAIKAVEGLHIDLNQINQDTVSQSIDAMVKADPQLAWLKDAEARGDIDWRMVKEIHESFDYDNSGLGPAAQLIIAIVASMFLGPLMGAIASNFAVGTVNGGGDLGAGFKAATSSDALKGYATQWATAYALGYMDSAVDGWKVDGGQILNGTGVNNPGYSSSLLNWDTAVQNVLRSGSHALVAGGINTAINGGSLKDNLGNAFVSEGLDFLAAFGNKQVGDLADYLAVDPGTAGKIFMHAVLGGALSAAQGGDFKTGALAGAAAEGLTQLTSDALGRYLDDRFVTDDQFKIGTAQIIGVLAGALGGSGDAATASWVAGNAERYNQQVHREAAARLEKGFATLHDQGQFLDLQPQDVLADLQKIVDGEKDPSKLNPGTVEFLNQFSPADLREIFFEPTLTEQIVGLGIDLFFPTPTGKVKAAATISEAVSKEILESLEKKFGAALAEGTAKGNSVAEALTGVTQKQLDKKFKHASDFGVVTTKKNPETLAQYETAIKTHMASTSTTQQGTYGFVKDSKVFFNSTTNNAVVLDASGNFVTGFKLAPGTQQFDNFIKNGVLR
ncbi:MULTISPECIES: DUF637 domain-containing protein [unclassified Pseudomonas]|uniref:DUF637 domain-containing protein n=1 Tax=unclassified Pseudomonas TaxID=196821 RepID=UPI002113B769|nr:MULTISPECIES: colicin D domain-containing protein [unclassified Pseudomonas]